MAVAKRNMVRSSASLYQVETRVLVQAVTRNLARFPDDFMFRLTAAEYSTLRSRSVISNRTSDRLAGGYLPPTTHRL